MKSSYCSYDLLRSEHEKYLIRIQGFDNILEPFDF